MINLKIFFFLILFYSSLQKYTFGQESQIGIQVDLISRFVGSEIFTKIRAEQGEIVAVDSIFSAALRFSNNNISDALVSCTWACLAVREAKIITPIFKIELIIPFVSSDSLTFARKNKNLPRFLFYDSPSSGSGDIDKLSHFFGSAFLRYNCFIPGFVDLVGYFIEVFEESFKVDSKISLRDMNVNSLGAKFADGLKENPKISPSFFLNKYGSDSR
jgi:hypothetical protein